MVDKESVCMCVCCMQYKGWLNKMNAIVPENQPVLSLTLSQTHTEIFECCCVVVEQNQSVIDVIRRTKLEAEVKRRRERGK